MPFKFDIINFSILLVFVLNTIFGLIVYSRDRKNATNRSFFLFTITITGWCLGMVLYRGFDTAPLATLFARILYLSAILIPLTLLEFGINFPSEKSMLNNWQKYLLPIPALLLGILSVIPHGLIQSITIVHGGENIITFNFVIELCYIFYISGYFLYFFVVLGNKFSYSYSDGVLHQQLFYILLGTFISSTIGIVSNMILLLLGIFTFNWLGQIGLIFMITLITFAILRYHLFNAKIISFELLVGSLWAFILIRIYLSTSTSDQIVNIAFLIVTIVIGLLLIASVRKEVFLREDLESANAGQANLIHIMNHQIKGYLGKDKDIFAELLTDDYGNIPDAAKPLIQKGLEESDAGVQYVTDILRGASAENGTLPYDFKQMDLKSLVTEVAGKEKEIAEKKGLEFDLTIADGDYGMIGDGTQLGEALRNLMENSIYYTPSGKIQMNLSRKDGKILFSIQDTGVGVKDEDKPKIFKAGGVGTDSLKVNIKSSGYGLAFVKGVVEAHKGKVGFTSAGAGKGSTFFVELPLK